RFHIKRRRYAGQKEQRIEADGYHGEKLAIDFRRQVEAEKLLDSEDCNGQPDKKGYRVQGRSEKTQEEAFVEMPKAAASFTPDKWSEGHQLMEGESKQSKPYHVRAVLGWI